jgi:hypothetical protein
MEGSGRDCSYLIVLSICLVECCMDDCLYRVKAVQYLLALVKLFPCLLELS